MLWSKIKHWFPNVWQIKLLHLRVIKRFFQVRNIYLQHYYIYYELNAITYCGINIYWNKLVMVIVLVLLFVIMTNECRLITSHKKLLNLIKLMYIYFTIHHNIIISRYLLIYFIHTQLSCSSLRSINISCNIGPGPLVKSTTSFLTCSSCFSFIIGFNVSRYSFIVRSNKGTGNFGSFVWKIKQ